MQRIAARIAVVLFILATAGCASEAKVEINARPAVVEQPVVAGPGATETYAGEVRARHEGTLGFRIAGKVLTRNVDAGAVVKRGDVLATLEAQDLQLQVDAARAAVAAATADLSLAKAELERHRELLAKKYISQALFEARLNTQKAAEAKLAQARSQLSVAQNQSGYTVLRADADGVVTATLIEAGQVVAAGTPVLGLARDGDREVLISVPENRIALFALDMPVVIEVWAKDNARFPGTVRELSPEADPRTRTYDVRVALTGSDAPVQLGMTARVFLDAGDAPPALILPLSALHEQAGAPAVWRLDRKSKQVHLVPVQVGSYREEGVALLAGVSADDWIVTAGVHKLSEGQLVRPIDRSNRPVVL